MNFETTATAVLNGYHTHRWPDDSIQNIGQGSFRTAFLHDGWVYKVTRDNRDYHNENEYLNFLRALDLELPAHVKIPACELVQATCPHCNVTQHVMVMEHIEGEFHSFAKSSEQTWRVINPEYDPAYAARYNDMLAVLGLYDLCGTNVIINNEGWWPIDLQM